MSRIMNINEKLFFRYSFFRSVTSIILQHIFMVIKLIPAIIPKVFAYSLNYVLIFALAWP